MSNKRYFEEIILNAELLQSLSKDIITLKEYKLYKKLLFKEKNFTIIKNICNNLRQQRIKLQYE